MATLVCTSAYICSFYFYLCAPAPSLSLGQVIGSFPPFLSVSLAPLKGNTSYSKVSVTGSPPEVLEVADLISCAAEDGSSFCSGAPRSLSLPAVYLFPPPDGLPSYSSKAVESGYAPSAFWGGGGAVAGIAVGCGLAFLILAIAIFFFFCKSKPSSANPNPNPRHRRNLSSERGLNSYFHPSSRTI